MRKLVIPALAFLLCASFLGGCAGKTDTPPASTAAAVPTTEEPVSAETAPVEPEVMLTAEYDPSKLCLRLQPTATTISGGDCLYYAPADQEAWLAAYESALSKEDSQQSWTPEDRSSGIWIRYQEDWREILESGDIRCVGMGRIAAEDAKELNALCQEALQELCWEPPVRPEQIRDIRSATLEYDGTHTLTDPERLAQLESLLSSAEEIRGGSNCWFTAPLTLELENGEILTLSMATDSCASCLSQGVFYSYSFDNAPFFELFGIDFYA